MNEKLYISPSLFYIKNKLHFESNDKAIKINSSNWHKYLEEYGWEKLPHGWKIRLKENASNFKYGILDCGAEGDCLFHCIGEALFDESNVDSHKYEVEELRKFTASKITPDNFDIILENYKCEEESYVFNGDWKPSEIKNIEELRNEVCKCGDSFWGDHLLLQLLQDYLKFNVIILNSGESYDGSKKTYNIHPLASDIDKYNKTIILYYEDGLHFKLVGYFMKGKMMKCFNRDEIPQKLLEIYNLDCHVD